MRRAAVLAPVLSLLAILSGCTVSGSVVAFDEERQTFQVDAAPVVVVETFNGRISVTSASAGVVEARVTRRGSGTSQEAAERDLANVRVDFELVGNRVTITARRVNQQTLGNSGADVEVLVPADSSVELRTSNGRVESANVSGSVIVRTSNGAVTTRGGSELDLDTTNGQISVNNPGGRLGIRTSNGSIDISSAKDVAVTAQTSNAPITFSGTLAPGQHAFATSNEDIAITLPGDTGFAFDGQTSNGLVRTEFTELTVTDTSITGSTGTDPQISIVARTSNGDLTVSTQRP